MTGFQYSVSIPFENLFFFFPSREDFPLYSLLPRTYAILSTRIRTIAKLVKVNERWQQTSALESGLVKFAVEVALSLARR